MTTGTVKFYNGQKGFGFIQPDNGGKDVFVHATALERAGIRNLVEGQKVSFDTEQDRRTGKSRPPICGPTKDAARLAGPSLRAARRSSEMKAAPCEQLFSFEGE